VKKMNQALTVDVARRMLDINGVILHTDLSSLPFSGEEDELVKLLGDMGLTARLYELRRGPFIHWDLGWIQKEKVDGKAS
jgi:hypothetical protein